VEGRARDSLVLVTATQNDNDCKGNNPRKLTPHIPGVGSDLKPRDALDIDNRW